MPFDEGSHERGGGDGCPCNCKTCHDRGFVHVMKLTSTSRVVEAEPCPAGCAHGVSWKRMVERAEAEMRQSLDRIFGGKRDGS